MFRVGVGVEARDAGVSISYITFMMRAQYKGLLGTVRTLTKGGIYGTYLSKLDRGVLKQSPVE